MSLVVECSQDRIEVDLRLFNKILLQCSGGVDSSALLYVLAEYFQECGHPHHIYAVTFPNMNNPACGYYSQLVVQYVKQKFPDVNITHELDAYFGQGWEKQERFDQFHSKWFDNGYVGMYGVTLNPPATEFKFIPPPGDHQKPRKDVKLPKLFETEYGVEDVRPFAHINKKGVREILEQKGIVQDFLRITRSCCHTKYIQCHQCFWCQEREWAFSDIDHEYIWPPITRPDHIDYADLPSLHERMKTYV